MSKNFKSGFITIVGRPNVGKSTLINKIIGKKISIVTDKAQTTRNNIRGILTTDEYQMVFLDTPGIHTSKKELDRFMNASALKSLKDVDITLFLVPADEIIGKNDLFILKQIEKMETKNILVITKIDLLKKHEIFEKIQEWNKISEGIFDDVIVTSSFDETNVEKLKEIIYSYLDNDYKFYEEEMITDQPNRFYIREIIREAVLFKTGQEIPHSVAILIDNMSETDDELEIEATIVVERSSQKGIIIGKGGSKISDIKYQSRKQLKEIFNKKIDLNLFVKVQENWRNSPSLIKKMGYDKNKY